MKILKKHLSGRDLYLILSLTVLLTVLLAGTFLLAPRIAEVMQDPQAFRQKLGTGWESYATFLLIQMLQVLFAFIPGEAVEFAAGYLYGAFTGTVLCLLGVAAATALIFGLTRLLGRKFSQIMLDQRDLKRLNFLKNEKNVELFFIIVYSLIGTPKDAITYFAGVTKIRFGVFMAISTFCRIPSILTSTLAGQAMGQENYLLSGLIFGISALVAIGGWLIYRKISKRDSETANS